MSAAFTTDGLNEVIGGPGIYQWRGGIKLVQSNVTYHYSWLEGHTMYGGYDVASGHILKNGSENIAVGSPNLYSKRQGHTGRVEILEYTNRNGARLEKEDSVEIGIKRECDGFTVMDVSRDRQHGAKFGATVAAIDINDDGIDELLVGAPLYSGEYPEEGRVYIYTSNFDNICGPVSVLSGKGAIMARFGSAIASIGDIDRDGAIDFAIGAPYEDDGVGAVYIYRGNLDCFCNINNTYSQRISGSLYSPNTRGFGWSIYGEHDIDGNSFPDFAVGAYDSDQTIVFRTRPIVDVNVTINISPKPIPLNVSLVNCSKDNRQLCFNVDLTINFTSVGINKGVINELTIELELEADKLLKQKDGYSRVLFRDNGIDTLTENITFQGSGVHKSYILDIAMNGDDPEPRDAWTPVLMEGHFRVLPLPVDSFSHLDPILEDSVKQKFRQQVQFDKKCESLDLCTSDLTLSVDLLLKGSGFSKDIADDTPIYVGEGDRLIVTVDVKNLNDTSYNANFSSTVGAARIGQTLSDQGAASADCTHTPDFARTWSTCLANSKLDRNENFKVIMEFDVSKGKLIPENNIDKMQQLLNVDVDAKQENRDTNPKNNKFVKSINIQLKYKIRILPEYV
ncbi:integrin alpha-4-like [Mya arenaria]|uniref:integrin alpha-4-like n=1 Tax=Mya arenaria TaxID=6604 RepID=UPI0022E70642|nr:integrin alpha-4-like [Mya arenaria]